MQSRFLNKMIYRQGSVWLLFLLLCGNLLAKDSFPDIAQLPRQTNAPDALVSLNGKSVTTRAEWFRQRRPELKKLFEHFEYGTIPSPRHFKVIVERDGEDFFNGKAIGRQVALSFGTASNAPTIHLLLVEPNRRPPSRGFPVFAGMNACGNFATVTNADVPLPTALIPKGCPNCVDLHATEAGRGKQLDVWSMEECVDRGYAVATFYCGDIEPDQTNATTGIRAFLGCGSSVPAPKDCGVIAAWAWGLSRVVDYLRAQKEIDPRRIALVGHSRLGKAAILAAALDERVALVVPLQAGCGGTAPARGKIGESVKAINDRFPHWFNDEFKKFNAEPDRLPFDQNCLIAMVAPRFVLIGCAREDTWSNPGGQFEMMEGADEVYRLLGVAGLGEKQMPEINHLVGNRLGYYIRPGKHAMTKDDWKFILDYADKMML
jgi:hypothetical protein